MRRTLIAALSLALLALPIATLSAADKGTAHAFTLPDLAGGKVTYSGKGEVILINFWATWCAPCAVEFPKLNELAADYKGKVRVVTISVDEESPKAKIEAFLKRRAGGAVNVTVALDSDLAVAEKYGVEAMPTTYIVDKSGKIRNVHVGYDAKDPELWRAELDALLKS